MVCSILTPRVLGWLENSRPARILNLLDEVCNLIDGQGNVISLVTTRVGKGPFNLIVENGFTKNLQWDQTVSIDPTTCTLTIGSLTIFTNRATIWNPKPDWHFLKTSPSPSLKKPPALEPDLEGPLKQLLDAIEHGDTAEIRTASHRLAGLGKGLTPSGDDVLMGVLYGLWVWYPQREWIRLIVETASPRTTSLSAAFLRAAEDGEATFHWHNLVNGHAGAVNHILSIGHTSGRDAWAGFTHFSRRFGLAEVDGNLL
jgi:hypothetical protein